MNYKMHCVLKITCIKVVKMRKRVKMKMSYKMQCALECINTLRTGDADLRLYTYKQFKYPVPNVLIIQLYLRFILQLC
jgi:hypothetical protein